MSLTVCLCVGLLTLAWAPARPAHGQATRPADDTKTPPAKFTDSWLSEIALDELKLVAETGKYEELGKTMYSACLARVCCDNLKDLTALNDMWYVVKACEFLPAAAQQAKGKALVKTLLERRELSRLLFRALDEVRSPAESIEKLHALIELDAKAVEAYPDLAVAFATTRDLRHYREQPEAASMEDSFKWYTTGKKMPFVYDLRQMPYEIARYLADTRLSIKERQWALRFYRNRLNPGKAYFDLKYDMDHYRDGRPKKIAAVPYTLPNLKAVGGTCIDQAYSAAEVCKAFGMPATIVTGTGSSGIGHAWLASLKIDRRRNQAQWDCQTGRYEVQKYYVGTVRNPPDRAEMQDCDLMLSGAAALLPLQRREEADITCELAEAVSKADDPKAPADRTALKGLADAYNKRLRKGAKPEIQIDSHVPEKRKPDIALVEDLIARSIELNLAHKPAWELIVELRKSDKIAVEHLNKFFDVLIGRTAKEYPDYSCNLVLKIVPTIKDPNSRAMAYQRTLGVYGRRPDLQGRILIAVGDDFLNQGNKPKALAAFEQAATKCAKLASVVLVAAERAEKMLLEANRRDMAIAMYERLFQMSRSSRSDSAFRQDTAYYRLGMRLAGLLADAGRASDAASLRSKLEE